MGITLTRSAHIVLEDSVDSQLAVTVMAKQEVITQALDTPQATSPIVEGKPTEVNVEDALTAIKEATVEVKVEAEPQFTLEQRAMIHTGLRRLAGMCDGARELDNKGFNKLDTDFGHNLAAQRELSNRQCAYGKKLCIKYRRQLGEEFVKNLG